MTIRLIGPADAAAIATIYEPYVRSTIVSFEDSPPDEMEMRLRIESGGELYPWLASVGENGALAGFAYASAFRARFAYRFTVETSLYLEASAQGKGLGRSLYARLLELLKAQGFTQAIAAITIPNPASVRLHEHCGFLRAGLYRDVGYKLDDWRSVELWQRPLALLSSRPRGPEPYAACWDLLSPSQTPPLR